MFNLFNESIKSGESLLRVESGKVELGSFRYFPNSASPLDGGHYEWRADYIQPPKRMIASIPVNISGYCSAYGINAELDEWLTASK